VDRGLDVESFSLPLSRPLSTAAGTIETREGFTIRTTVDGSPGLGEATPLPDWTESLDACERALEDVDDPVAALADGRLVDAPAARHGVSLAVLDARARAADRPLYRKLGRGERVESVPVNATVGDCSPAETVAAVEAAVSEGYPAVKVKIGGREPAADLERIEAVRSICQEIELRIDANGAWEPATARRALPELAALDVAIIEQPLAADRLAAHADLRDRGVEIALDEGVVEHGVSAILEADAADVVVCKPMALGGIDAAREAIRSARRGGSDAIVTTTVDGAIARAAAVHLAASVPAIRPCGLGTGELLESDLRESVAPIADGAVAVPQGKGNILPR
jgi:o-succinylbenzoate synthase